MDFFFAFLGLIWLTYRLGKEDGAAFAQALSATVTENGGASRF